MGFEPPTVNGANHLVGGKFLLHNYFVCCSARLPLLSTPSFISCRSSPCSPRVTFLSFFLCLTLGVTWSYVLGRVVPICCYADAVRHELIFCSLTLKSKLYLLIFKLVKSYNESCRFRTRVAGSAVLIATTVLFGLHMLLTVKSSVIFVGD